jgi:two-component system NtrC family sensor kinase
MNENDNTHRHLLIRSPIANERSCYTADCHAHTENQVILGSLIIKIPLDELDNNVQQSSGRYFLFATIVTLLLITALILFTQRQIKTPLNEIVKASLAVAGGDKKTRLNIKPDQLEDMQMVSRAFNEMLDNLQSANEELKNWSQQLEYKVQKKSEELGAARNELIHIERIASLGKLSSSVAHEINNPLSGILVYTKLIHKQLSNPDLSEKKKDVMLKNLKLIETETKRCGDIVKGLLDFSREEHEDFEPKHIHSVLREAHDLMAHTLTISNLKFQTDFKAVEDTVLCSSNQIKQACVAMIVNASEAITENGEIILATINPDAETIRIDISDNGIGIAPDEIPHIFEPFYSTKRGASGIGLGLAIVHGIVKSHNGKIGVKSEPGRGTTMSVTLPLIKTVKS